MLNDIHVETLHVVVLVRVTCVRVLKVEAVRVGFQLSLKYRGTENRAAGLPAGVGWGLSQRCAGGGWISQRCAE